MADKHKVEVTEVKRKDDKFPDAERVWHPMKDPVIVVDTDKDGTKPK